MNFIKKNKVLILIFLFALFIRLIKLDTFPLGFHVDEAKVGWEAFSILKTLRDDHGNLFSLYYNSFGDYRTTGIFYFTIPFLILFGKTIFAVRFASALFGALTVFPLYFIAEKITKKRNIAIASAILLSIIPWDIATSRATSEVVISCFMILCSLTLLQKKPNLSFLVLNASFLLYHSVRIMGPLLMLISIIYFLYNNKLNLNKKIIFGFLITIIFSIFLLFSKTGLARYNQVKLNTPNLRNIIINYTSYFDPNFLIGNIAKPFRYVTTNVGIVSIPIFLCFLFGVFVITKTNKNKILLLLFALGPIPASLTLEDSPNLHRSFFMMPFLVIIAAIGLVWIYENHKTFFKIIIFSISWSFISFLVGYFNFNNNFAYEFRNPYTKEIALYVSVVQKNYDKIYVTNDPDSPYSWYAFFENIDPENINPNLQKEINGKWQYQNIIWDNTKCPAADAFDEAKKSETKIKILVVDNGNCFTDFGVKHKKAKIIKEYKYNEKTTYRIWEYQN